MAFRDCKNRESLGVSVYGIDANYLVAESASRFSEAIPLHWRGRRARSRAAGRRAAQITREEWKQERMGHRSPASTVLPDLAASSAGDRPRRGMASFAMSG
jgi:hypothetical protein